jgi:hypothetical protein
MPEKVVLRHGLRKSLIWRLQSRGSGIYLHHAFACLVPEVHASALVALYFHRVIVVGNIWWTLDPILLACVDVYCGQ